MSDVEAEQVRRLALEAKLVRVTPRRFRDQGPLQPLIVSVVRNEQPRLADFLAHYRKLGVGHFLFIDNGSTDGTLEILSEVPDADVFVTHAPFNAINKQGWVTQLVRDYGDRWYLLADADELAVFHGAATVSEVSRAAERLGRRRVRAALLDMYSDRPLGDPDRAPDQPLLEAYPFFDASGYIERREAALTTRIGGPRRRVFSQIDHTFAPQLTKYPLFRLRSDETLVSPHFIHPPVSDEDPCWIALLHFKFDTDSRARIADAIERKQYWRDSYEYRVYEDAITRSPGLTFMSESSRRYRGNGDLVDLGIIEAIPRSRAAAILRKLKSLVLN